jgi:hypothetical protein
MCKRIFPSSALSTQKTPSPLFRLVGPEKVARDDLHDMVVFATRYNPNRAMSFG